MRKILGVLITFLLITSNLWAAGFQLFNEGSARVMSLGASVTGRTDLVESTWYNPSATAFFKNPEVMIGTSFVYPSIEFKSDTTGKKYEMTKMLHPLPFLYLVQPLNKRFTLNFSFNIPYGLTTDWDGNWEGRYEAVYTSLRCYFFTPTISIKLTNRFSIGLGPQIVYADAKMKKYINVLGNDIETELSGNDWAVGWIASLTYKVSNHTNIGLIYRSQISLNLEGEAKYYNNVFPALFKDGDAEVFLDLPDTLSLGISTYYFPKWILSFDLLWSGWSTYEELKYKYEYKPGTGQPGTIIQSKNWHDVLSVRLGAEYLVKKDLSLRFSYVFDPSPIDDDTRGAELPTDDRHLFSLGIGYKKKKWGVDFAYTYLIMSDTHPGSKTSSLKGEYEGSAHIASFDFSYKF